MVTYHEGDVHLLLYPCCRQRILLALPGYHGSADKAGGMFASDAVMGFGRSAACSFSVAGRM